MAKHRTCNVGKATCLRESEVGTTVICLLKSKIFMAFWEH